MVIRSIDDLDVATPAEIKKAMDSLQLKKRVLDRLHVRSNAPGLTLEEYNREVEEAEKLRECGTCGGTGKVRGPMPRTVGCIHPSSATACRLALYYDVTGEIRPQKNLRAPLHFTFAIGHAIHDLVQGVLAESIAEHNKNYHDSLKFEPEARVDMGLVQGNTDGSLSLEIADAVLEIKSDGPSTFGKRKGPNPEHRVQAEGLYATGLDKPFVVYLYVQKEWPHSIKEYVRAYDPRIFSRWWRNKGRHVQEALEKGEPPLADAKASECRGCQYAYACPQKITDKGSRAFRK